MGDERIASLVKERAEKSEGAIRQEDDAPKEQETWKNTGGATAQEVAELQQRETDVDKYLEGQPASQAQLENKNAERDHPQTGRSQKIMDELNDSKIKIAELQQEKLKQKKKHLEEAEVQRTLNSKVEQQKAEIDHLRMDLSMAFKDSEQQDKEIIQLRASLQRFPQKSAGFFSNAQASSLKNQVMTDVQGDFHLRTDREKRGNVYCLIPLIVLDELPIAADGKEDAIAKEQEPWNNTGGVKAQKIMDELNDPNMIHIMRAKKIPELPKPKMEQRGCNVEKHEEERALKVQVEEQKAEIDRLVTNLSTALKQSKEKEKEISQLRSLLQSLLRQEAEEKKSTGLFSKSHDYALTNPVKRGNGCLLSNLYCLISLAVIDELPIAADGMYDSLSRFNPSFCYPGTHEKVLHEIADWVDKPDPKKRILWVNGLGGTGKSTIAQTIIKRYKGSRIAATFFFLKGHADCGHADRLFTTLAWQMAKSIPETCRHIESVLNTQRPLHTKDLGAQFRHLFVEVFRRMPTKLRPEKSLVVIDGIDELSPERQQTSLLTLIGDRLATPLAIPLRFIIFSRPEKHIERIFLRGNMSKVTRTLALDKYAPKEDIRKYLTDKFHAIFTKRKVQLPSDRDIDILVSLSWGQFIVASTVVSFIDDDDFLPQEQLNVIKRLPLTEDSPFTLIDQLYIHILSQQKEIMMLKDLFVLLIALGHPKLSIVSQRLGINEEQLRLKLHAVRALVHITDSSIGIYHRTLHDFFLDGQRSKKYYINPTWVDQASRDDSK